ncbi:MAG TPA: NifB/NifX family molybdenum-iron cluster-binding protein [bacterium]|nr:NifB/NifX family molybdenum-iron cluster-binding protein [bacterium]
MRLAIPCNEQKLTALLGPQFGRAAFFAIYDPDSRTVEYISNSQVVNTPSGAGVQAARHIIDAGAAALLSAHCGPKAFRALQAAGIPVYVGLTGTVQEAIDKYNSGAIQPATNADVEGHWA